MGKGLFTAVNNNPNSLIRAEFLESGSLPNRAPMSGNARLPRKSHTVVNLNNVSTLSLPSAASIDEYGHTYDEWKEVNT
jgi:hypothetical protein